ELLEVVLALAARGRLADLLDRRDQQRDQDRDDRDHDEELDEREAGMPPAQHAGGANHENLRRESEKRGAPRARAVGPVIIPWPGRRVPSKMSETSSPGRGTISAPPVN